MVAVACAGLLLVAMAWPGCVARAPRGCSNVVLPDGHREPLRVVPPLYPEEAVRQEIVGFVELSGVVSADGAVTDIRVEDSEPDAVFDQAAIRAWSQWRYCPEVPGEDETERVSVTLRFVLGDAVD